MKYKIRDKVKTGYGIGRIVDTKALKYIEKCHYAYFIEYEDGERLWALETSIEKLGEIYE